MSKEIQNAQITTQATIGTTVGLIAVISIINLSSPVGIWCVIKQIQILMLVLLTGAYIPLRMRFFFTFLLMRAFVLNEFLLCRPSTNLLEHFLKVFLRSVQLLL